MNKGLEAARKAPRKKRPSMRKAIDAMCKLEAELKWLQRELVRICSLKSDFRNKGESLPQEPDPALVRKNNDLKAENKRLRATVNLMDEKARVVFNCFWNGGWYTVPDDWRVEE